MEPTTECETKEDQYIIDNYRKLPTELVALGLDTTPNIIRCRATYLRKKGKSVARCPIIQWGKNEGKRSRLMEVYGTRPTHRVAKDFGTTIQVIHRAATSLGLHFRGNDGRYTFSELSQIFKTDEKIIKSWTNFGLRISGFAKDGCTNPITPKNKNTPPQRFNALIDSRDLKKFLKLRPEAYDLSRLDAETKHLFELTELKTKWKEKKLRCKKCKRYFWTKLHNPSVNCPKCGRFLKKWAVEYRT